MISIPIIGWVGKDYFDVGVIAGVLLQACTVLTILQQAWGTSLVAKLAGLILVVTWLLEFVGSQTGFPFGQYHYSEVLQPQVGGVPLLIPIAWLMMLPVSWAVAFAILQPDKWQKSSSAHTLQPANGNLLRFAALAGLAMTVWDLFLDPQMTSWNYWVWEQPGGYFGIPWINFVGWWLSATLITWFLMRVLQPQSLPVKPLLVIYTLVWALQSVGQGFFWNQPGPAIVGFIAMGTLLGCVAWRRLVYR